MEQKEIMDMWNSYNDKINNNLIVDKNAAEDLTKIKVRSSLATMKPLKIFFIILGVIWVAVVDLFVVKYFNTAEVAFIISAVLQSFITKLAIGVYLYHMILLNQIDMSEAIIVIQEKLAALKTSSIWVTKILFLQLPLWTTFYLSEEMFLGKGLEVFVLQALTMFGFTFISVWLFININYKNRNKKWFKLLFDGREWTPLLKSLNMLDEIQNIKSFKENSK